MTPERYKNAKWEDMPQSLQKIVVGAIQKRKGVYIHGTVGTGKTHIAYAIANKYKGYSEEHRKLRYAKIWNVTELLHEIRQDFNRDKSEMSRVEEELNGFKDLVILDDIGSEKMTDWVAETFYLIINKRYNHMRPTIFTSNLPISDLAERVGDRVASRIVEMCEVVELVGSDRRITNKQRQTIQI